MPPLMVPLPAGTAAAQYAAPPAEVVVPTKLYNRPPRPQAAAPSSAEVVVPTELYNRPPGEIAERPAKKQRPAGQRKKKRR